jgi:hypothetical protein
MAPSQAPAASPESLVNFFNYSRLPEAHECFTIGHIFSLINGVDKKIRKIM